MTSTTDATTNAPAALDDFGPDADLDWDASFADDEPLACGIENPESCESCQ